MTALACRLARCARRRSVSPAAASTASFSSYSVPSARASVTAKRAAPGAASMSVGRRVLSSKASSPSGVARAANRPHLFSYQAATAAVATGGGGRTSGSTSSSPSSLSSSSSTSSSPSGLAEPVFGDAREGSDDPFTNQNVTASGGVKIHPEVLAGLKAAEEAARAVESRLPPLEITVDWEMAFDWEVTKRQSWVPGPEPNTITPVPVKAYVPIEEPIEVLKRDKKSYKTAVANYGEIVKEHIGSFDELDNFHPQFVENLIRNKGFYDPDDYTGAGPVSWKLKGFLGDHDRVEHVRAILKADVSKTFEGNPEAFDRFAQLVGPRLDPKTLRVRMSCDYYNNSVNNRDHVVKQFAQAMEYAFGPEKWAEMKATMEQHRREDPAVEKEFQYVKAAFEEEMPAPKHAKNLNERIDEFVEKHKAQLRGVDMSRIKTP